MATNTFRNDGTQYRRDWYFGGINWSAIFAGLAVGLGLLTLLMLFGTALGLSVLDPYKITRHESSYGFPAATIAWLVVSALASAFLGAWVTGALSFSNRENSIFHTAIGWGLGVVLVAMGVGGFTEIMPAYRDNSNNNRSLNNMTFGYSSLDDREFTGFVLDRARDWRPGVSSEQPVNVSAEVKDRVDPDDVADNDDLHRFVKNNTKLSDKQTDEFLESEKNAIAREQAAAQERWEARNAFELAKAERIRKAASTVAWTLTAIGLLSLATALAGGYMGWYSRRNYPDTRTDAGTFGSEPMAPTDPPSVS